MRYWLNECVWKLMKVCLATPQISHTLFPVPATRNAGSPRMVLGSLDTFLNSYTRMRKEDRASFSVAGKDGYTTVMHSSVQTNTVIYTSFLDFLSLWGNFFLAGGEIWSPFQWLQEDVSFLIFVCRTFWKSSFPIVSQKASSARNLEQNFCFLKHDLRVLKIVLPRYCDLKLLVNSLVREWVVNDESIWYGDLIIDMNVL